MPYYVSKKPLSPLSPEVISRKRIERFFEQSTTGGSIALERIMFQIRMKAVEFYKGYYIPQSLSFYRQEGEEIQFTLTLLPSSVDARVAYTKDKQSPWTDETPKLSEIEAYWQPLTERDLIQDMVTLFNRVEAHVIGDSVKAITPVDKLSSVTQRDVDINTLQEFCLTLGAKTPLITAYIEDHIIFAAHNPKKYLQTENRINNLSLNACRAFTWKDVLLDEDSPFKSEGFLCEMDWKSDAEEVAAFINHTLSVRDFKKSEPIQLNQIEDHYLTETYLDQASKKLKKRKLALVYVHNVGDSYIFTILDKKSVKKFVKQGKELGLETNTN